MSEERTGKDCFTAVPTINTSSLPLCLFSILCSRSRSSTDEDLGLGLGLFISQLSCITKCHRLEIHFSQFWRLEAQDQGSADSGSVKSSVSGLQMATTPLCPHMTFSLCPRRDLSIYLSLSPSFLLPLPILIRLSILLG